jgi:hypothetical protein
MATMEEHLQRIIGDLVFRLAAARAEIDALKAQLASPTPPPERPDAG